ncbi:hypothetical protein EMIT07CA2_160022 [Brevibacillus sp. IT-7CA2]
MILTGLDDLKPLDGFELFIVELELLLVVPELFPEEYELELLLEEEEPVLDDPELLPEE